MEDGIQIYIPNPSARGSSDMSLIRCSHMYRATGSMTADEFRGCKINRINNKTANFKCKAIFYKSLKYREKINCNRVDVLKMEQKIKIVQKISRKTGVNNTKRCRGKTCYLKIDLNWFMIILKKSRVFANMHMSYLYKEYAKRFIVKTLLRVDCF